MKLRFNNRHVKGYLKSKATLIARTSLIVTLAIANSNEALASQIEFETADVTFEAVGRPSLLKIRGSGGRAIAKISRDEASLNGTIEIALDDFTTGIDLRDQHMKEKYLNTKIHPKALLTLTSFALSKGWSPSQSIGGLEFQGNLKLKGVTQHESGRAEFDSSKALVRAEFTISLKDFDVGVPQYMGITVADTVTIRFVASGIKESP